MPHLLSTEGPALAVSDVNGDGLDDVYLGGAKWQAGELWLQRRDGGFRRAPEPAFAADSVHEDIDAVFVDADGDGDRDLYVVSGGNEFWEGEPLRDRLYLNDGRGDFRLAQNALPDFYHNGSCVAAGDYNGDGHVGDVTPDVIANAGMVSGAAWVDGDLIVVGEWMPLRIFHQQSGAWVEHSLPSTSGWWN